MNNILQTILERAEHRHEEHSDGSGFLATLAQQVTDDLRLSALTLWAQTANLFKVVVSTATNPDERPGTESSIASGTGSVTVVSPLPTDENNSGRQLQTSVPVARDIRLIVRATEGTAPVNHDILLQLSDIFADLHRRNMLDELLASSLSDGAWQTLIAHLHNGLDSRVIANTIATDATPLLSASRIAVGRRYGRLWKIADRKPSSVHHGQTVRAAEASFSPRPQGNGTSPGPRSSPESNALGLLSLAPIYECES